jgi:hypothetical protein
MKFILSHASLLLLIGCVYSSPYQPNVNEGNPPSAGGSDPTADLAPVNARNIVEDAPTTTAASPSSTPPQLGIPYASMTTGCFIQPCPTAGTET